jgi:hypothetical protein
MEYVLGISQKWANRRYLCSAVSVKRGGLGGVLCIVVGLVINKINKHRETKKSLETFRPTAIYYIVYHLPIYHLTLRT